MLIYAFNCYGRLIRSDKAVRGVDYYCPCCGAVVRLKISKKGVPFFFCHHSKHTEKDCARFAGFMDDHQFDDIDVRKIMLGMLRITNVEGPPKPPGPGGKKPKKPVVGLTTMHHLWMAGIPYGEPDMPVQGGILADYLIGPKAFEKHLSACHDIGQRIIMCMPERVLSNNRIRFRCPWMKTENGRPVYDNKRLTLHFPDSTLFVKCRDKLFEVRESGYRVSRFVYVLVAADWLAVARDECMGYCYKCRNSENCCGMLYAECCSANQIYIPRNQKNRRATNK